MKKPTVFQFHIASIAMGVMFMFLGLMACSSVFVA